MGVVRLLRPRFRRPYQGWLRPVCRTPRRDGPDVAKHGPDAVRHRDVEALELVLTSEFDASPRPLLRRRDVLCQDRFREYAGKELGSVIEVIRLGPPSIRGLMLITRDLKFGWRKSGLSTVADSLERGSRAQMVRFLDQTMSRVNSL